MRDAMRTKYHFLKYYYTGLANITAGGGAFYKPLFFEFPNDTSAYENQQYNVMLGPALKLSVNSDTLGQNTTDFYFPNGTWCNILNSSEPCVTYENSTTVTLDSKAYDYYVHLREGFIVPMQNATGLGVNTTTDLQDYPVDFHVNPACNLSYLCLADGQFINDDGLVLNTTGSQNIYRITYDYSIEYSPSSFFMYFGW